MYLLKCMLAALATMFGVGLLVAIVSVEPAVFFGVLIFVFLTVFFAATGVFKE